MTGLIDGQAVLDALGKCKKHCVDPFGSYHIDIEDAEHLIRTLPSVAKWIPVTPDTLPEMNRVVVVCGEKGTWNYGTYRGYFHIGDEENIHRWWWKKNTLKEVYWWMYKEDAIQMPREEGDTE